ncbi:MAG: hypothetical protein ACXW09_03860 [Methylococcaceae bacterium]
MKLFRTSATGLFWIVLDIIRYYGYAENGFENIAARETNQSGRRLYEGCACSITWVVWVLV